jgi:uncharacterized SAM-binding protein YcdF (DUF218 family)
VQPKLEALVVLGCRFVDAQTPSPAAGRRIARAAQAFAELGMPRLLISGGRRWHGLSEAELFSTVLSARGVPASAIELEMESLTTRENARCSARWLEQRKIRRFGVVTCDFHMARALAHFRRLGLDAVPVPARSPAEPRWRSRLRALGERARFAWSVLLPAPLHELTRFFR